MKVELVKGCAADRDGILDLANLVFSQNSVPHDFRALLPKVYGDGSAEWMGEYHYLVKEDGQIKALVACPVIRMNYAGETFSIGLVGTVCVHSYRRGRGYMTDFMNMMIEDTRKNGVDLLALGGRHARYQYYGFESCGSLLSFHADKVSADKAWKSFADDTISFEIMQKNSPEQKRSEELYAKRRVHAERPSELFHETLCSWKARPLVIRRGGAYIGYLSIVDHRLQELMLEDESLLRSVLYEALMRPEIGGGELNIPAEVWETDRIRMLVHDTENYSISNAEKIRVHNWQKVLRAAIALKASAEKLPELDTVILLDQEKIQIAVKDQQVTVEKAENNAVPALCLSGTDAVEKIFAPSMAACKALNPLPELFPLPFCLPYCDKF